jgi:putative hydrolase of HD superfamily
MRLEELLRKINSLKEIPRIGWTFAGISLAEIEDVAQHSFEVASITLLLCDELEKAGRKIDLGKALAMAIVHDWPEALVGDFPFTAVGYLGGSEEKHKMEEKAAKEMLREKQLELWREYVEKKTAEAKLVHAADYLSMLLQALRYKEGGNISNGLKELSEAVLSDLSPYIKEFPVLSPLLKEIKVKLL